MGIDELRAGQTDAIAAILEGHDVLAVMATGYGKSAIFQTAAAMLDGVTVVVSPLIALQQDQVESLRGLERRSAPVGAALHSKLPEAERTEIRARIRTGDIDILYLSPEQLVRDDVREEFDHVDIALVAVDEAHCVSSWGHEFRPDYLRVADAVEALGRPPIIALTATAAPPVRDDIVEKLRMRGPVRITGGFDRPEIRFEVDTHADESTTFDAAVRDAVCQDGQGLVYVDTRAATEKLARELVSTGTELRRKTAAAYHGGMRQKDRDRVAEAFAKGDLDVVVATSAFGMGIDKADIRFVIHAAAPGSVDSYYQEAGRVGRDGRPALARLHYHPGSLSMQRFFATRKVDESLVRRVVGTLNTAGRSLPFGRLRELVGARSRKLTMTTNLLVDAGAVVRSHGRVTASEGTTTADAVADAQSLSETEQKYARSRVEMMRGYAEAARCRRRYILEYFGEPYKGSCDNCDVCSEHPEPEAVSDDRFTLNDRVNHPQWGRGTVSAVESDRITVLFDEQGYKTLSLDIIGDDLDATG